MMDMNDSKLVQDVVDKVGAFGLPYPTRPHEMPDMPDDLSNVTGEQLGSLMGRFAALIAYAQVKVAEADTLKASRKAKYEIVKAKTYLVYRGDERMTEKQREHSLETHTEVAAAKRDMVEAEQVYELTKALLSGYTQQYGALSRELTRRGVSSERGYA